MKRQETSEHQDSSPLARGLWVTALGTLASRCLGLVRDIATASLLGAGGVTDALVIAFRIPNLARRLLGEGALAVSYLPALVAEHERDPAKAWQLASVVLAWLTVLLAALVLFGEMLCGGLWLMGAGTGRAAMLLTLTAALLPYMLLVCLAAQISATLQAMGRFTLPALTSSVLNICWIAACFIAPRWVSDTQSQALVVAGAVLTAGILQIAVQLPPLRQLGFRFNYNWSVAGTGALDIARAMVPITLGLAVTQINTLADSLIAWGLSTPIGGDNTLRWLGGVACPLHTGAVSAIYFAERFYQLPIGLVGVAVATVIFPLLARKAARGDREGLSESLELGMRITWFVALPCSAGLVLLAEPITRVLLEHGRFDPEATIRVARMTACYAAGIWAYCALPVIVRGYYAVGDRITPMRIAIVAVCVNLALNLTLIWPLAEIGLAISTVAAAVLQMAWLLRYFHERHARLSWVSLGFTAAKAIGACSAMCAVVALEMILLPEGGSRAGGAARLALMLVSGGATYLAAAWALGAAELRLVLAGRQA